MWPSGAARSWANLQSAGTFGTLLPIFYLDYLGMIGLISGLAMILAAVLLTWYSLRGRTL